MKQFWVALFTGILNRLRKLIPRKNILFKVKADYSTYTPETKQLKIQKNGLSKYVMFDEIKSNNPKNILLKIKEISKERYYNASNSYGASVIVTEYKEVYHVIEMDNSSEFGEWLIRNGRKGLIGVDDNDLFVNLLIDSSLEKN